MNYTLKNIYTGEYIERVVDCLKRMKMPTTLQFTSNYLLTYPYDNRDNNNNRADIFRAVLYPIYAPLNVQ